MKDSKFRTATSVLLWVYLRPSLDLPPLLPLVHFKDFLRREHFVTVLARECLLFIRGVVISHVDGQVVLCAVLLVTKGARVRFCAGARVTSLTGLCGVKFKQIYFKYRCS